MIKRIFVCDKCLMEADKELWRASIYKPNPSGECIKSIDLCEDCKDKLITWAFTK